MLFWSMNVALDSLEAGWFMFGKATTLKSRERIISSYLHDYISTKTSCFVVLLILTHWPFYILRDVAPFWSTCTCSSCILCYSHITVCPVCWWPWNYVPFLHLKVIRRMHVVLIHECCTWITRGWLVHVSKRHCIKMTGKNYFKFIYTATHLQKHLVSLFY